MARVQDLMARWVREQEQQLKRARIIADTLENQIGEFEVDEDTLLHRAQEKWERKSAGRVARELATPLTLVVYELMDRSGE